MSGLSENEFKEWKIKRKRTTYGYLILSVLCGIDYSFLFATLYLYLTTILKTDHANFYYGIIIAAFYLSSTLAGVISGYIVDKNRKMKSFALLTLTLQIIGNLIYSVPYSPVTLLVGRFIAGASDCFTSVACGEIVRLYNAEEGTGVLWKIASAHSIGSVIGPCIGAFFKGSVEFQIGPFFYNYINFTSVVISGMCALAILSSLFLLHDCSLELNMKDYLSKCAKVDEHMNNENTYHSTSFENEENNSNLLLKLKQIFINKGNVLLIMISSFVFVYCLLGIDMLLPLLTMNVLEWRYYGYVIVSALYALVYFLVMLTCSKRCITSTSIYFLTTFCILCNMICLLTIILMIYFERKFIRDVFLMASFLLAYTFVWFLDEILVRCLLSRMVPSHVQSLVESIRNGFSCMGTIVASLTVAIAFPILPYWCIGMLFVMMLFLFIFSIKYKSLINIEEIKVS